MATRPNAQDSTRRNVQAANKRIARLQARLGTVEAAVAHLIKRVNGLEPHAPDEPLGPEIVPGESWR